MSLPRDAMVERPTCFNKDEEEIAGGLDMWNAAFSLGGPACTIRQFEQLTKVKIDQLVRGNRADQGHGQRNPSVPVHEDVDDSIGDVHLQRRPPARPSTGGPLDYRVRHAISNNGDIGRMKRQQAFIAAMANKVKSAGTLGRPGPGVPLRRRGDQVAHPRPGLDSSVKQIADLAGQFQDIGLSKVKFITVPFAAYEPDPNRLVWTEDAEETAVEEDPLRRAAVQALPT